MDEAEEETFSEASDVEQQVGAVGEEVPEGLSSIAAAAYTVLNLSHVMYRGICWNVTSGRVVGEIAQTPLRCYWDQPIEDDQRTTHSDEFAQRIGALMAQGRAFVDFASLGPPDGKFLEAMQQGIRSLHESGNDVIVRVLTGNIVGMPTDNKALCRALTTGLPRDSKIKVWVGSWRKGLSWNHSKIIAIDGQKIFTGGHNVWDPHYLKWNPVRDVSMEAEGQVAKDGHMFLNRMWQYVEKKSNKLVNAFNILGFKPALLRTNVSCQHFPHGAPTYPPLWNDNKIEEPCSLPEAMARGDVPMLTIGRFGELHHAAESANPSDAAIVAMLASAEKSIKLCLQDLGPLAVPLPTGPMAIPGGEWPRLYLRAIGQSLYQRGADVHIVLSTPNSIPADLTMTDANYGNGWTCEDVASEIIRSIKENHPSADEERLSGLILINLKVTYMRSTCGNADWKGNHGKSGNHAKFFMIDDQTYYVGSQNLYIANLAEWGIVVDSAAQSQKILEEYWNPLWQQSWDRVPAHERDLDVHSVLAGCDVMRVTPPDVQMSDAQWEEFLLRKQGGMLGGVDRKLSVWLISATNLRDADHGPFGGSSDSYVHFDVVDGHKRPAAVSQESTVKWDAGADPTWNEQFDFEGLENPQECTLRIKVLDKDNLFGIQNEFFDSLDADDSLGYAEFKLERLVNSKCWQHVELVVDRGIFSNAKLKLAFNTCGGWGK